MIRWLQNEGVWYFGAIWPVFQILNVSVRDLTDLHRCLNNFLVPKSISFGTCMGGWHVFGIPGATYVEVYGTT